jgi:hypothetical protein
MKNQSNAQQNNVGPNLRTQRQHGLFNQGKGFGVNPDGSVEVYDIIWRAKNYDSEVVDIPVGNKEV